MNITFSDNLRRFRLAKKLTQEQVADSLRVSAQSVSRWECGNTYPDVMLLPQIARLYGVTVDDLYREKPGVYENYAIRLASVYESTRDPADFIRAEEEFRKLIDGGEYSLNDMRTYGVIHQFMMQYCMDKAEQIYDDIISGKYPGEEALIWRTKHQRQGFLKSLGRGHESVERQLKIVTGGNAHPREWVLLMDAYRFVGDDDTALQWYRKAAERFPDDAMVIASGGDIFRSLKQYPRAFACWDRALELNPGFYDCKYAKGFCYEELGEYGKAYETWLGIAADLERDGYEIESKFPRELAEKCKVNIK